MLKHTMIRMTLALAIALALGACGDDAGTDSDGAGAGGTGGAGGSGGSGGEQDSGVAGTGGTGGSGGSGGTGGTGGTGGSGGTGGADAVDPTPFAGNWTGGWTNTTFGSMGDATLEVTPDTSAMTVTFTIDLDGNVFGGSNPPAETFTGPYDADGYTVSGTSATFGTLTLSISESGAITGSATPSRGATTFTGTASESELTINYTIEDAPNPDITGVLTFTK